MKFESEGKLSKIAQEIDDKLSQRKESRQQLFDRLYSSLSH
jgi:hypothetical protein